MKISKGKTKNSYHYLHINKNGPVSLVLFLVKNGSRHENSGEEGISHFIEHMMFKQTEKRSTKQISMDIETIGGQTNAFTGHEYTGYYIKVLKDNFSTAFEILSDIVQNGIFDEKDIEIERGNIIEEIRMYEDDPREMVGEYAQMNIFPENTLGKSILGTEASVSAFKAEDLKRYIQSHYHSDDFLIVTVGDLDEAVVAENIEKHLKDRPKGRNQFVKANFKPKLPVNFYRKNDSKQAHVVVSYPGIKTSDPSLQKYEMLDVVLGDGFGSILYSLLREKLGVAYYVGSSHYDYEDTGAFHIYFGSNIDKTGLTIEKLDEELKNLMTKEISAEELERARNLHYSAIAMAHENVGYLGQKYGLDYLLEGKIETLEEVRDKIYKVTTKDILETANQVFTQKRNITYIANKEVI